MKTMYFPWAGKVNSLSSKTVSSVVKPLQDQCDAQAAQILDQFSSERKLEARANADTQATETFFNKKRRFG